MSNGPEALTRVFSLVGGAPFDPRALFGERGDPPFAVFRAESPVTGAALPREFLGAGRACVAAAVAAAERAGPGLARAPAAKRAELLRAIADGIVHQGDLLIAPAVRELGQSKVRLRGERDRCVANLHAVAALAGAGAWLGASIRTADTRVRPPRPDVRCVLAATGPVAVYAGPWEPLMSGVIGLDAASALAAGCPLIVRASRAHPHTDGCLARVVLAALARVGLEAGCYSLLYAAEQEERDFDRSLLTAPGLRSLVGHGTGAEGAAWRGLSAERRTPLRVFDRVPLLNPVFVLPSAIDAACAPIARRVAAAVAECCGQQPTRPGLVFAHGVSSAALTHALGEALGQIHSRPMATRGQRDAFGRHVQALAALPGVEVRGGSIGGPARGRVREGPVTALPTLLRTTWSVFCASPALQEGFVGPGALVVACASAAEMLSAAEGAPPSLAASIFAGAPDAALAQRLAGLLEGRTARLIFNDAASAAGAAQEEPGVSLLTRWCRQVRYQNAADAFLPPELRNANPLGLPRTVNGEATSGPVPLRMAA